MKGITLFIGLALALSCTERAPRQTKTNDAVKAETADAKQIATPIDNYAKPTVKVYIENSGSMDGYITGKDIKDIIYSYLTNINVANYAEKQEYFYINSNLISINDNLDNFKNLTVEKFKKAGGNRGSSDIAEVIGKVLDNSSNNEVSLLVSDFIISPGKGRNATEYVKSQQTKIKGLLANALRNEKNMGVLVYQCTANFNGIYYNITDAITKINAQRPFYIFAFGKTNHLKELQNSVPENKIDGLKNVCMIASEKNDVEYKVAYKSGEFNPSRKDPHHSIVNARKSHDGKLHISINADFNKLFASEQYLLDINNYEVSAPTYKIDTILKMSDGKYQIRISSDKVVAAELKILLRKNLSQWVIDSNDDSGVDIKSAEAMDKTFGIKYIVGGIYDACTFSDNVLTELKININKE